MTGKRGIYTPEERALCPKAIEWCQDRIDCSTDGRASRIDQRSIFNSNGPKSLERTSMNYIPVQPVDNPSLPPFAQAIITYPLNSPADMPSRNPQLLLRFVTYRMSLHDANSHITAHTLSKTSGHGVRIPGSTCRCTR